jgi:large subunit ribosomal protein L6
VPANRLISVEVGQRAYRLQLSQILSRQRAALGTYASHVRNMIEGVNTGFVKKLFIEGVGYKWDVAGKTLNLALGFSHPVKVAIPEGLTVTIDKGALSIRVLIKNWSDNLLQTSARLRSLSRTRARVSATSDEVIRRKQGKKAA